jgi:hypothetical protein
MLHITRYTYIYIALDLIDHGNLIYAALKNCISNGLSLSLVSAYVSKVTFHNCDAQM